MKEINKPSSALNVEARAAKEHAWDYINEHRKEVQTSLEYRGILSKLPVFNPEEKLASNVFAGAIMYAADIFAVRLVLGCSGCRREDTNEIIDHLQKILEILNK